MAGENIRNPSLKASGANDPDHPGAGILRSAAATGIATLISRVLGLVREQVFAILFGASNAMDAFNVAFRIPNLLRDLFAEGAMSASLVPTFVQAKTEGGDRRGWRTAGLVFRVLFFFVASIAVIGILFSNQLVSVYAPTFKDIPGKFDLTVRMTQIMFPFFPLVALAAAFMGVLNACGYFFLPAFASALFNVGSVIVGGCTALWLFKNGARFGIQPIEGMAFGVLAGGLVQALSQVPALYRCGYRWYKREESDPTWHQDPYLKKMLWMMVPGTIGLAATQVNILVNTILATGEGPGAVSWLSYAFRLMQFPIGVFGVSLATATLPRISQHWVNKQFDSARDSLVHSLRQVFAINLPASAGLIFLGLPIIQLLFQYGAFYYEDAQKTAMALAMYSIGLSAYSAVKVLVPACYAMGNTRVPVISSVTSVVFAILLNLITVRVFGYWSLALGTSLAAVLNFSMLIRSVKVLLGEKNIKLSLRPLFISFTQNLLLSLAMGICCLFTYKFLDYGLPDNFFMEELGRKAIFFSRLFKVTFVTFEGVFIVFVIAQMFGLQDTILASELLFSKIKKKLRRISS